QAFKNDWDEYATTNIEPGIEKKYHINNFDALLKPFAKDIEECKEKPNARIQQKTWGPKN
ncbi:34985_t:CDS:2, partial [Gigaspora margarita]